MLHRLERMVARSGTGVAPRLSISPSNRTAGNPAASPAFRSLLGDARRAEGVEAMHTRALIDLLWVDSAGQAAERAIEQLRMAADAGPPSARLLSDLAAAHLVRAERGGGLMDVQHAIEAAGHALEVDSLHAAARFNLALALDRMAVDSQAVRAWRAAAAADPRSAWADEAERQVRRLTAARPPWRSRGVTLAASAKRFPQEARLFAMDTLLGRWGEAVLRRDSAAAALHLRDAETIGAALASRGGDLSVADMVGAIRRHGRDPAATARLARAHALYARVQGYLEARKATLAQDSLDRFPPMAGTSPALASWAECARGTAAFYAGSNRQTVAIYTALLPRADTVRHPAVAGRAHWVLGTVKLRAPGYETSRRRYVAAARFFARAGERENLGNMQELEAEALFGLGNEEGAYERMRQALETLRPYRSSQRLHNLLYNLSQAATVRGLNRVSLWLQEEDVAVAMTVPGRPGVRTEALLARARSLAGAGALDRARQDARRAAALIDSIEADYERRWQIVQLRYAEGGIWVRDDPRRAVAALDSVLGFYRANVRSREVASFVLRAEARLALGAVPAAVADLDSAAVLIDSFSTGMRDAFERAMALANGRRVFERLVMLHVGEGRRAEALAALERARVNFGSRSGSGGLDRRAAVPAALPGEVVLDYALIGDTLLNFVVRGRDVQMHRATVDGEALAAAVAQARAALEQQAAASSIHPPLERLFDLLIRPVQPALARGPAVAVVADGVLAEVPFAALRDAWSGRYLFQDHELRFAPSLLDAVQTSRPDERAGAFVFVADPAFSPAEHPSLRPLPDLGTGARRIAAAYPGATVITGSAASAARVRAALEGARLFHFGGHAVFDPDRPSRSYLVVAPQDGDPGRLHAAELAAMDLKGVRLVVLSACETQRSSTGRSGGFSGLSAAFLDAGAGGVVGSLWKVREGVTQALMEEFHRAYRVTGDADAALRTAQLRLLGSADSTLRSPAAWAGFRYAGS